MKYLYVIKFFAIALFFYSLVVLADQPQGCKNCNSQVSCDGGQADGYPNCEWTFVELRGGIPVYSCESWGTWNAC